MEPLNHFSHDHALISYNGNIQEDVVCYGCNQPIIKGSFIYSCSTSTCNFFLHETCAKLPQTLQHPMHQAHSLTLYSRRQYNQRAYTCTICWGSNLNCFTYACESCNFAICLICIFDDGMFLEKTRVNRNVFIKIHNDQHTLTLLERPACFECDACGMKDEEDSSFSCNTCSFWIHQSCASLENLMKFSFHKHPLTLANSLPHQYRNFRQFCYICKRVVVPRRWLYYCEDCRYFVHLKCASSSNGQIIESSSRSSETESDEDESDEHSLVQFPLTNEPSLGNIIQQYFIKTTCISKNTTTAQGQIMHWSHKHHPLVLLNNLETNNDPLLCDGCVGPIRTDCPFYGCIQCEFFLHTLCAKLPLQINDPSHNHNLVCGKYNKPNFYVKCNQCKYICNGMFYSCERCKFYLDIRCAMLPNTIKHKSHSHPLNHHATIFKCACQGCGLNVNGFFGCKDCNMHLCTSCTFLPRTIKHRWDPHPIKLVYPPIENHPDKFYCEICEEEIDSNQWLYFCRTCDQSFHKKCVYPYFAFINMKYGGKEINVHNHHHSLTFVGMKRYKFGSTRCGNCGNDDIRDGSPVLECEPCYFRLCRICSPSNEAESLVEACERIKEAGPKLYTMIYKKLISPMFFVIMVIFIYTFPLWVAYKCALFLWTHPFFIVCIIVLWFGVRYLRSLL